jgi:hypothetical protein
MPLFGAASGPPSPTYSAASTRASFDAAAAPAFAGPLITRSALRASLGAYEELLGAAKAYTAATLAMSAASAALAGALEGAARIKGAHAVGSELQAAAGLHHLLANSQSLVADVLWRDVSIPLLERFDAYRAATTERQLGYEADIRAMSQRLKATEERNLRTKRKKERDLASFKLALRELQEQVEALDEIKRQHYVEVREAEEEVWAEITGKVSVAQHSVACCCVRVAHPPSGKGLASPAHATRPARAHLVQGRVGPRHRGHDRHGARSLLGVRRGRLGGRGPDVQRAGARLAGPALA